MSNKARIEAAISAVSLKRQVDGPGWDYMARSITKILNMMLQAEQEGNVDLAYRKQLSFGLVRVVQDDYILADGELGLELASIAEEFGQPIMRSN